MPAVPPAAARPGVPELLDEPAGLLDAPLRLGGARLGAAAQPLDLAAHRVGERLLVGGLAAQELVAAGEELAVRRRRSGRGRPGRRGSARACGWPRARGSSGRGSRRGRRAPARRGRPPARGCRRRRGGWWARPSAGRRARRPARARSPGASASRPTASSTAARPSAKPARPSACAMRPGRSSSSTRGQGGGDARPRRCRRAGRPDPAGRSRRGCRRERRACRGRAARARRGS